MSKTYNNVPMSEELAKSVARSDAFWTGPKLIMLTAVTLGFCFTLLWLMANRTIGPTFHNNDVGNETHDLQLGSP